MNDLRYGLRRLREAPAFTITALATVAICLGANLAMFAVIDSVLLKSLPFPHADRLVSIYNTYPNAGVENDGSSFTNYYERRGQIAALSSLSIYLERAETVGDPGAMRQEDVVRISPDFFTTLGVSPAIGRNFTEEDADDQKNVIILSNAFWRQQFDADPDVLGRETRINGIPRKVVGVLPSAFRFLSSEARVFLPIKSAPEQRGPNARHSGGGSLHMIARLQPGATIAEAQSQIDAHNAAVEKNDPQAKMMAEAGFRSRLVSLHAEHVRSIRPTLLLLQAGALLLLLIGAVNLVNLLLIRASDGGKDIATRQAIGATRWHLVRQVVAEPILLAASGGSLGVVLGAWGTHVLQGLGANRLPLGAQIAFDGRLTAIGLAGAVVLGIAIAMPIAWFNHRSQLTDALAAESRGGTMTRATVRLRHGFVIVQIALAFVLLAGAALLGVSLKSVMALPTGFHAEHAIAGKGTISWEAIPHRVALIDRLLESIRQQPGVAAAGTITNIPLSGDNGKTAVTPQGYAPPPGQSQHGHYAYAVHGDYFPALGIPLREGRYLTSDDSRRTARTCVVDEEFARRYWPNGGAVGRRVALGDETDDAKLFTIVGIVGAVKQAELTEPQGQGAVYVPYAYRDSNRVFIVARLTQRPEAFADTLSRLVRATDPRMAIDDVRSMDRRIDDSLIARRSPALLAVSVAGVALLLAAIGTYGVLSYAVAQRRREIGIRMALGARKEQIGAHFLSLGLRLLAAGSALGVLGAWLAGRAMRSVLFDVPTVPIAALLGTVLVITTVSVIACLIPARRATQVDPMIALRAE